MLSFAFDPEENEERCVMFGYTSLENEETGEDERSWDVDMDRDCT